MGEGEKLSMRPIQGDEIFLRSAGDVFYVIEEGTFTIFDNSGKELARVSKGSCFGELALLHQVTLLQTFLHVRCHPCTLPQSR
jgi:hypothetical protein